MIFNEYMRAVERFIRKTMALTAATPDEIAAILEELCVLLRIGKVEMLAYTNEASEHLGLYTPYCYYDCGQVCDTFCVSRRMTTNDDSIVVYKIYPIADAEEWSENELEKIQIFIALFSTLNGKLRLIKLTNRLTYFDSDFDMYNLKQFMKNVRMLCKEERVDSFAAVRFNLKRFSVVNQQLGRENGTCVMKQFIACIDNILTDSAEVLCRIGGDNFIVLIYQDKLDALLKILSGTPIVYDETRDERINISATVGVYVIPDMDSFVLSSDIMDRVSMAFSLAKNSCTQDVVYFDDQLLAISKKNNDISACFPKALEEREFLVYYQPKVAVDGLKLAGAEALCRWLHNGRLVPPGDFIPVLEQGRDICKLDFYMLDAVCRDIRRWLDSGRKAVRISVNLSRRHLSDMDLLKHILDIVDRHNIPHEYIEIELTETTTDVEFTDLKRTISGLQKHGISTSVDDFGIGYSSLNLIKEIPWDVLKLDKSLLPTENEDDPHQKALIFKYIVAMAQEMGLECIAEGVETSAQVELLCENNCNLAQGFFFDKPLPIEEFEKRLDEDYVYSK
ncbi:MAG: GGDEF domain-containing phosphodiesterase [Ruminococcus sp.]|uniref:GGDEF domain-containing phosphodiesterase n=1 Tax=Ruminococcus sp. TaxID=41978 RepID=UPI0026003723|nr:GGDEF domain-containing phosphodiesterase [Ruminococcus sp.]MCR5600594.1 GGDEF domain-containing phosphodiesterase [Ruminococcus sp.]